ncbi:Cysteine--tRNA ligase [Metamycoplasma cloacale]|uniref:Cysteine--tRNA ligase n=1 Tax=Metamycoplasma cloacale TaxID=92401 RepID=A0A2Z4LME6_9BACT|nr:class I tRNA ligase family protein [Metamycoplasma cloacale]AWX42962.1 cysteine--tRNA ligase [Metamycoplasma cloacale]VEU79214.1 Cysteine--tRNA ligase [Metamycoplasma cloacale]
MKKYYLCGPTVYNYPHIGNIRPTVTFDLMIRAQRYLGENVYYLHNITDIDDKIIKRAIEENKTEKEIASFYEQYYWDIFKQFNLELPTKAVRVTDSLNEMYEYIQALIDKGAAYQKGVNVFFDVEKYKNVYGSISGQKLDNLNYDNDKFDKKNPSDFALWKDTNEGVKYNSPFGLGRPGWHTECSCFINKYFNGETLDYHGGGLDLIFPHHENENIQHYALHNAPISKGWLHFGTINYKDQKMSKSIGNLIFPHTFLEKYDPETYKLMILTTNYAKPINITDQLFDTNQKLVNKFKNLWNKYQLEEKQFTVDLDVVKTIMQLVANLEFANAYKEIFTLTKDENNLNTFFYILRNLGFAFLDQYVSKNDIETYKQWKQAVADKNYELSDELRAQLQERKLI